MAKKEFTYRGRTVEQLQKMSIKEFAALIPSAERRALLRGMTDVEKSLLNKLSKRPTAKTQAREMVIVPQIIGKVVMVHTGKEYVPVTITEEMIGFRLGEFAPTRKSVKHASPGVGSAAKTKVSVK
jgi:small subunit ribosomal protein S19